MTKPPTYNLYPTNIYQVHICLLSLKVIRAVVMLLLANQWMINWSFTQFLCRFWLRWPGWDKRNAINYWKTPTTFSTIQYIQCSKDEYSSTNFTLNKIFREGNIRVNNVKTETRTNFRWKSELEKTSTNRMKLRWNSKETRLKLRWNSDETWMKTGQNSEEIWMKLEQSEIGGIIIWTNKSFP